VLNERLCGLEVCKVLALRYLCKDFAFVLIHVLVMGFVENIPQLLNNLIESVAYL